MKIAVAMLQQWHRENPARLLQAALLQAERRAQMAPELEALRAQTLHCTNNWKSKQSALLSWKRRSKRPNAPRTAKPLLSVATPKNAPWRPSGRGASGDIRAPAGQSLSRSMSSSRSNSVPVHTAVERSSRTIMRLSSSLKIFHRCAPTSHG